MKRAGWRLGNKVTVLVKLRSFVSGFFTALSEVIMNQHQLLCKRSWQSKNLLTQRTPWTNTVVTCVCTFELLWALARRIPRYHLFLHISLYFYTSPPAPGGRSTFLLFVFIPLPPRCKRAKDATVCVCVCVREKAQWQHLSCAHLCSHSWGFTPLRHRERDYQKQRWLYQPLMSFLRASGSNASVLLYPVCSLCVKKYTS